MSDQDTKVVRPKLFCKQEERLVIKVTVVFDTENGEVFRVVEDGLISDDMIPDGFAKVTCSFSFLPVSYKHYSVYKRTSLILSDNNEAMLIDKLKMRALIMLNHLKDTDVVDDEGNKIELVFDVAGNISADSLDKLYNIHPSIIDNVIDQLETKCGISYNV